MAEETVIHLWETQGRGPFILDLLEFVRCLQESRLQCPEGAHGDELLLAWNCCSMLALPAGKWGLAIEFTWFDLQHLNIHSPGVHASNSNYI